MSNAYDRIDFRGHTLDRMTAAAVEHLEDLLGGMVRVVQGCYNAGGVAASAGTHDGGGAVDLEPTGRKSHEQLVHAGRLAGFAIWHRPRVEDLWEEHDHGILIGNTAVSAGAAKQVHDYYAGLNGLADHAPDHTARPNPITPFRYPLGKVNLDHVVAQARAKKPKAITGVKHIQEALNLKRGAALAVDGVYGPQTKAAYARWEKQVGGDGDGIPATFALKLLGASQFTVVTE